MKTNFAIFPRTALLLVLAVLACETVAYRGLDRYDAGAGNDAGTPISDAGSTGQDAAADAGPVAGPDGGDAGDGGAMTDGGQAIAEDAGADASAFVDAGTDAGVLSDAGADAGSDASTETDAGQESDGGAGIDAGGGPDGGAPDAGPNHLALSGPSTMNQGDCSAAFTATLKTPSDANFIAPAPTDITLAQSTAYGRFFADPECAVPLAGLGVDAGASSATFHLRSGAAQSLTLSVAAAGFLDASVGVTIAALPFSGDAGFRADNAGGSVDYFYAAAIDSLNRIVVVGKSREPTTSEWRGLIARLNPNGAYDPAFNPDGGTPGRLLTPDDNPSDASVPANGFLGFVDGMPSANFDTLTAVALDSQGRIVVAGFSHFDAGAELASFTVVARYLPSGVLDSAFGQLDGGPAGRGVVLGRGLGFDAGARWFLSPWENRVSREQFLGVATDTEDRVIAVGGVDYDYTWRRFSLIARYRANGEIDTAFNADGGPDKTGFVLENYGNRWDYTGSGVVPSCCAMSAFAAVHVASSGRIVAVGTTRFSPAAGLGDNAKAIVAVFLPNGQLDTASFNATGDAGLGAVPGTVIDSFAPSNHQFAASVDVDPLGNIFTGWGLRYGTGGSRVVKLLSSGYRDPVFNAEGYRSVPFLPAVVRIDPSTNNIYVAGHSYAGVDTIAPEYAPSMFYESISGTFFGTMGISRLYADGGDDPMWYDGGTRNLNPSGTSSDFWPGATGFDRLLGLVLDQNQKPVVVGGTGIDAGFQKALVVRFTLDGQFDN